jgi:hypothetical protein
MKMRMNSIGPRVALAMTLAATAHADGFEVVADNAVGGFRFPESVACDAESDVLYVSEFVSALKPSEKDGQGRISKVARDGAVIEAQFLPAPGDVLHKPKGVWIAGERLWVTDIDAVWVFDIQSRKGRKLALPGAEFANDVALAGETLYVTDNRLDTVFAISPADFLDDSLMPAVTRIAAGRSIFPNGIYPAAQGGLLLAGMAGDGEPRGIYLVDDTGDVAALTEALGRLDGLYQTTDGTLLTTDWSGAALLAWREEGGRQLLAGDFTGPADFCALPTGDDLLVVVPDLVKGELRLIRLH